jgi:hypothetical protein
VFLAPYVAMRFVRSSEEWAREDNAKKKVGRNGARRSVGITGLEDEHSGKIGKSSRCRFSVGHGSCERTMDSLI